MSTATHKMTLFSAYNLAQGPLADLGEACERIEIAGSIRRRSPEVGDVELVAIPKTYYVPAGPKPGELLGVGEELQLDAVLGRLCVSRRLVRIKGGERFKQFWICKDGEQVCKLDLFIVTRATWGVQLLIRTGPAEFSQRFVTQRHKGGWLPDNLLVRDGRLVQQNGLLQKPLDTPEEADVFRAAGHDWIEPCDRK